MSVILLDLAKRFVDGTLLNSAELAYGRDAGIFGTHGPTGTWALTEFGQAVISAGKDWIKLVNGQDNVAAQEQQRQSSTLVNRTTFGSKGRHDNNADMIAAILFGAGLGCVVMWFITVIAKALAT